jgi:hypothetical protein
MTKLFKLWDKFWFSRFDPVSACVFRIFIGALLLIYFIALYPSWDLFYARDGIISLTDPEIAKVTTDKWSLFYLIDKIFPVRIYYWLGFAGIIMFLIGFKTRIFTVFVWVLIFSMTNRTRVVVNGEHLILETILFFSCFLPLGYYLSVDKWLDKKRDNKINLKEPSIWPLRLIQINIILIYVFSTYYKITGDSKWLSGEFLYWTITNQMWGRFPYPELFYTWDSIFCKLLTYSSLFIEASFPILIWFKNLRFIVVIYMIIFHLLVIVMVPGVLYFNLAMICSFFVFIPQDVIRNFLGRFKVIKSLLV